MIILTQNTNSSITVYLELQAGGPATGLLYTGITVQLKKEGEVSFSPFTLSGGNFTDLTNGFYEIDLTSTNTNTLGNLYVSITGTTIKTELVTVYVAVAGSITPTPSIPTPGTTKLYGYLSSLASTPISNASISAKILSYPTLVPVSSELVGITSDTIVTKTNASGYFELTLVEGISVDITIPSLNYRRTLTVPASDTNLFNIL